MELFWFMCFIFHILLLSRGDCAQESDIELGDLTGEELELLKKLLSEEGKEERKNSATVVDRIKDFMINETSATNPEFSAQVVGNFTIKCSSDEIECSFGGLCIHREWECDGIGDCPGETDEIDCFECIHGANSRLLPRSKVCDDIADCPYGEDEHRCKSPCDYSEFQCDEFNVNSLCIPEEWTCDAHPDCESFADESIELCGNASTWCKANEFKCGHGLFCVPHSWRCDLGDDCGDNSDEQDCGENRSLEEDGHQKQTANTTYSWAEWSEWSQCSSPCDGEQIRTRRCNTGLCEGNSADNRSCGKGYPCISEPPSGCGTRSFEIPAGRIVGGRDAQEHEWPWQVQMFRPGRTIPFCGGSLIRRKWILTAAHCFDKKRYPAEKYSIALGRRHTSRRIDDGEAIFVRAMSLIIHESYKKWRQRHDIALMELAEEIPSTEVSNVVCLASRKYDWLHHRLGQPPDCYVTGFGINEIGERPLVLQEAHVYLIDHESCSAPHVYGNRVTTSMICAGHLEGGIDACQGDSGGPLVCQHPGDGRWYQVGITSWGKGCGLPNRPGVYTKVSKYLDWIKENISERER